ncbi:MAG: tetratricopeptide repeat protein [Phycisphaeraceae bacterium]|nr:tetratricopeptide repeat protein [Phycisphaeraceae bacterium]
MTLDRSIHRAIGAYRPRLFSALAVAAAAAALGGCAGHGQYTSEHIEQAQGKLDSMKAAVEWQMAQQQFLSGDLKKAERTVERALMLNPKVAKSHVLRGRILIEKGELEAARQCMLDAEAIDPQFAEAQYYIGFVHERFSQYGEAFTRYARASSLDEKNPQYTVAAGEMLVKQGKLDEAAEFLESAAKRYALNSAIRQSQGHVEMLRGNAAGAADALAEARLLAPDDLRVLEELVNAQVAAGRFNDADGNLDVLMRGDGFKDRRDLRVLKSRVLVALGRLAEARTLLVSLTGDEEGLRDVNAWMQLGLVSAKLNDPNRLRQASARVVALAPEMPEAHLLRATFYRTSGERDKAIGCVDRALELNPGMGSAMVMKAMIQTEMGQDRAAVATLRKAVELDPGNANARQLLAMIESGAMGGASAAVPDSR